MGPLPPSLCVAIGPPRSGTTLIANAMMAHSAVRGVMEPYQARRGAAWEVIDPHQFISETLGADRLPAECLLIKETTTRARNVSLSLDLLARAAGLGVFPALVIIFRCPFRSFLSQVEASRTFWPEKKLVAGDATAFASYAQVLRHGLGLLCRSARAQHFRLVSYEAFCDQPALELARLMALLPLPLEPEAQLAFAGASGGDPKTARKAGRISVSDRAREVAELLETQPHGSDFKFMAELSALVTDAVGKEEDRYVLDLLTVLCLQC